MSYEIDKCISGTLEATEQIRQTVASQFMDELEGVRIFAEKVAEETAIKLASVMLEPSQTDPFEVEKASERWPPLFNEARSKTDDIEVSLRRIAAMLRVVEL